LRLSAVEKPKMGLLPLARARVASAPAWMASMFGMTSARAWAMPV
jgi:hypothetical protein